MNRTVGIIGEFREIIVSNQTIEAILTPRLPVQSASPWRVVHKG